MSSIEINNQVNTVTVSDAVALVDITESTARIEVYNSGVGPQGVQGLSGVQGAQGIIGYAGIVTQPTAPINTSVLWVDSSDPTGLNPYNIDGGVPASTYGGATSLDFGGVI